MTMTETALIQYLVQGGFAALFVWLFFDTRRDSKSREERLMLALEKLAKAYDEQQRKASEDEKMKDAVSKLATSYEELAFVRRIND